MLVLRLCFPTYCTYFYFSSPCFKFKLIINNAVAQNPEVTGHLQAQTCALSNENEELPVFSYLNIQLSTMEQKSESFNLNWHFFYWNDSAASSTMSRCYLYLSIAYELRHNQRLQHQMSGYGPDMLLWPTWLSCLTPPFQDWNQETELSLTACSYQMRTQRRKQQINFCTAPSTQCFKPDDHIS